MIDAGIEVQVVFRGRADGSCGVHAIITRDGHTDPSESLSDERSSFNRAFGLLGTWAIQRGLLDVPSAPPEPQPSVDAPAEAGPVQCAYCLKPTGMGATVCECEVCGKEWHVGECARQMLGSSAPTEPGDFVCRFCEGKSAGLERERPLREHMTSDVAFGSDEDAA